MEREALQVFSQFQLPQQRFYNMNGAVRVPFPTVLSPTNTVTSSLMDFMDAIKAHKPWILSQLHDTGAILFRGFPVNSASDFNDVVEAFGFEDHPYEGGAALRSKVVGRVFTANESPPDQMVPFHPEMSYALEFPTKLFFFCEVEPRSGGETPIVLSHVAYERIKERHPEFVQQLEEHGLLFVRVMDDDDDTSSAVGRGWKSTFSTQDKTVAEERAAKQGMKLEWLEDGVRAVSGPFAAVRFDKTKLRHVWFNAMVGSYTTLEDVQNNLPKSFTFGDGRPLPTHIVYDCQKILKEESVSIPWQKGDVLLLDNWAVLHSRRLFDPPRRILASLCK